MNDVLAKKKLDALVLNGLLAVDIASGLLELRQMLVIWTKKLGVTVVVDPTSSPRAIDFLAGVGLGGASGALTGAAGGALIGSALENTTDGMVAGAIIGGIIGAIAGANAVANGGVRVRIHIPVGPTAFLRLV